MSPRRLRFLSRSKGTIDERINILFSEGVKNWLDVVDDGVIMIHRLKVLEHLLLKCCNDLPSAGCRFSDVTQDGYDGSEMMYFLDES